MKEKTLAPRPFRRCSQGWTWVLAALALVALGAAPATGLSRTQAVYEWERGDFRLLFESAAQRDQMQRSGAYVPGHQVPFDVDVDPEGGQVFLSLPWMLPGAALTLATIAEPGRRQSPLLAPYPSWAWQAAATSNGSDADCSKLVSAYRTTIDRCGRLWVIDSGIVEIAASFRTLCPPKLLAFDLRRNGSLLLSHTFGDEGGNGRPLCRDAILLTVMVEVLGECAAGDAYAYVADTGAYVLRVYSTRENRSWTVNSFLFYPDVNERRISVAGDEFEIMDGVLALALSPRLRGGPPQGDRWLFFHALSSLQEGRVRTSLLRNASNFEGGGNAVADEFQFIGERSSQAAAQASTYDGIVFFSVMREYNIICWNSRRPYNWRSFAVVERDEEVLRFVTGIKAVADPASGREAVWAVANNGQRLFAGTFVASESNVTIVRGDKERLVAGTVCSRR